MLIDIRNKVIVLQSMQWGTMQPNNYTVTFEQLSNARKGDSFQSEPYSMCREAHHEVLVVDNHTGIGRISATVYVDGYTPEEDSEYFEYNYPLYLQLPEDCSVTQLTEEPIQEVNVKLPGDDAITASSKPDDELSDEALFGAETLRKIRIAREQRGQ